MLVRWINNTYIMMYKREFVFEHFCSHFDSEICGPEIYTVNGFA